MKNSPNYDSHIKILSATRGTFSNSNSDYSPPQKKTFGASVKNKIVTTGFGHPWNICPI